MKGNRELDARQLIDEVEYPIALVLGIARLGEVELGGWWKSHGLMQTGRYVLGRAFPRTALHTGLELDILAAARLHEDMLGRATALHLFSEHLPFRRMASAWLAEGKTDGHEQLLDRLQAWTRDSAAADLKEWIGEEPSKTGEEVGIGLRLGKLRPDDLQNESRVVESARLLTAAYLDQGSELRPPYFDLVEQ